MAIESNSEGAGKSFPEPDSALMSLVEQGNPQALTQLFERHSRLVYAIALRVLKDPAAAEDVMQEIFLQIWRTPKKYQSVRGGLGAWLAVVSRNRAIDVLRGRRPTCPVEEIVFASPSDLATEAEQHIVMGRVREAVAKLPHSQRDALELAFLDGCTHAEIAEKLNQPLGTVKTRIRSALHTLAGALHS